MRPAPTSHGWLGLALWAGAVAGSLAGVDWVRQWFYQLAWWGYILAADAAVATRGGGSLIRQQPRGFWLLAWVSVSWWLLFELVNLRLHNWHYEGVAAQRWARWLGAFLAFATVLPGVHLTGELLRVLGLGWGRGARPRSLGAAWKPWFIGIGATLLIVSLIWPRLFFPAVWLSLIFLLEPLNYRLGASSFMAARERGDLSPLVRLPLAGLVCGLLWESMNALAGARWVYTLPYLNQPRLFAMPLAGYLGFPPFALECGAFMASLTLLRGGRGWGVHDAGGATRRPLPPWLAWLLLALLLPLDLWVLWLMDAHLYMVFAP